MNGYTAKIPPQTCDCGRFMKLKEYEIKFYANPKKYGYKGIWICECNQTRKHEKLFDSDERIMRLEVVEPIVVRCPLCQFPLEVNAGHNPGGVYYAFRCPQGHMEKTFTDDRHTYEDAVEKMKQWIEEGRP